MTEPVHNNTYRFGFGGKEPDLVDWEPCTEDNPCEDLQAGKCCDRCTAALKNMQAVRVVDHSRGD